MAGQEWNIVSSRIWDKKEGQENVKYFYIENEKLVWKSRREKTDERTASERLENVGAGLRKKIFW